MDNLKSKVKNLFDAGEYEVVECGLLSMPNRSFQICRARVEGNQVWATFCSPYADDEEEAEAKEELLFEYDLNVARYAAFEFYGLTRKEAFQLRSREDFDYSGLDPEEIEEYMEDHIGT